MDIYTPPARKVDAVPNTLYSPPHRRPPPASSSGEADTRLHGRGLGGKSVFILNDGVLLAASMVAFWNGQILRNIQYSTPFSLLSPGWSKTFDGYTARALDNIRVLATM